jgi:hypothetical protein
MWKLCSSHSQNHRGDIQTKQSSNPRLPVIPGDFAQMPWSSLQLWAVRLDTAATQVVLSI